MDEESVADADELSISDFDFDDELDQDSYYPAYQFTQCSIEEQKPHIEDMRGNPNYCLNMKQVTGRTRRFWVLLDNQSTVHIFWNTMFLTNVRKTDKKLELYTNAGSVTIDEIGELPGVGTVWVHRDGIANILSFHALQEQNGFEIDYTSRPDHNGRRDKSFKAETQDGQQLRFQPDGRGLYYIDCEEHFGYGKDGTMFGGPTGTKKGTSFLEEGVRTVEGNKKEFTKRDVQRAEAMRRFQHVAGHPSDATLVAMTTNNSIRNSPFTSRDVRIAHRIFGPSVYGLKGKRGTRKKDPVVIHELTPLPKTIEEYYKDVVIGADVMHVNQIPMMATISRGLKYGTVAGLPSMKAKDLEGSLMAVVRSYKIRGFTVRALLMDKQFDCLIDRFADHGIEVNTVSRAEHVPEIERYIRVIKERARATDAMTPFTKMPRKMVTALVERVVYYMNAFPWTDGASKALSPATIVEGKVLSYDVDFQVLFGEYAQTFEGSDNTMTERTVGAIALGPSGNIQGGVRFMSLSTGEYLDRAKNDYTLLPMPAEAITRVERMARKSRNKGIIFSDRNNDYVESEQEESDSEDDEYLPEQSRPNVQLESSEEEDSAGGDWSSDSSNVDSESSAGIDNENDDAETVEIEDPETNETTGVEEETSDAEIDEYRTSSGRVVRSTQEADYVYTTIGTKKRVVRLDTYQSPKKIQRLSRSEYQNYMEAIEYIDKVERNSNVINDYVMAQMSVQEGLKIHGVRGKASVMKEINNLVSRDCFGEVNQESLTAEQKRHALPILMFMVVKRDGTLKSRGCADGRPQRLWTTKQENSSPTPAIESLKYVLATIAMEERDVASFDLPGQFLQTDMDTLLFLKISGAVALLLVESDRNRWKKHLRKERGRPVIYVKCKKAIYGTLNAAILAYRKLTGHLSEWGLEMNPYEPCVWNAQVKGSQLTVIFHVDDGLVSHKDPECVTDFLKKLDNIYGKTDPLTIQRGKIHEYLGMTLDLSSNGRVMITMYDYIKKLIDRLPKDMVGERATAAPEYLFKVEKNNPELLDAERKEIFHTLTATALYLTTRTRADMKLATGFLCTHVRSPDEHDWRKLTHLMKYLQATAHLPCIIGSDGTGTRIYMDGAHAVHVDMKGHAGVYVTEGTGTIMSSSSKLKLNTLSSTETELVTVGEHLPKCMWYRLFRMGQGDEAKEDVLMQDNESAMLLENNGRMSAKKGSKHIDIRYFFVTDRIEKKHIRVEHCPTKEMIADFFTKPLQGALFHKFRDAILGIDAKDFDEYKRNYYEILEKYRKMNEEHDLTKERKDN